MKEHCKTLHSTVIREYDDEAENGREVRDGDKLGNSDKVKVDNDRL